MKRKKQETRRRMKRNLRLFSPSLSVWRSISFFSHSVNQWTQEGDARDTHIRDREKAGARTCRLDSFLLVLASAPAESTSQILLFLSSAPLALPVCHVCRPDLRAPAPAASQTCRPVLGMQQQQPLLLSSRSSRVLFIDSHTRSLTVKGFQGGRESSEERGKGNRFTNQRFGECLSLAVSSCMPSLHFSLSLSSLLVGMQVLQRVRREEGGITCACVCVCASASALLGFPLPLPPLLPPSLYLSCLILLPNNDDRHTASTHSNTHARHESRVAGHRIHRSHTHRHTTRSPASLEQELKQQIILSLTPHTLTHSQRSTSIRAVITGSSSCPARWREDSCMDEAGEQEQRRRDTRRYTSENRQEIKRKTEQHPCMGCHGKERVRERLDFISQKRSEEIERGIVSPAGRQPLTMS